MRLLIFLALLLNCLDIYAQDEVFLFESRLITHPCVYEPNTTIQTIEQYDVYQTEDGKVDGPRIEQCLSWEKSQQGNKVQLSLGQIDLTRPLFMAIKDSSLLVDAVLPSTLEANTLYNLNSNLSASSNILSVPDGCDNDFCSEIIIDMSVPSFSGDSTVTHRQYYSYQGSDRLYFSQGLCIGTDNLIRPTIDKVVFKIVFKEDTPDTEFICISYTSLDVAFEQDLILSDITVSDAGISGSKLFLNDITLFGDFKHHLVVHTNGYPGEQNKDVKLIKIDPNPAQKIDLEIQLFTNLIFQRYTSLGTQMVNGSNNEFHSLNLILNGGSVCVTLIVDVVINNGGSLRYNSGEIMLQSKESCINFKNESTFILSKEKTFTYGQNGSGVLGLTNGKVLIEEGASLTIDADVFLDSRNGQNSSVSIKSGGFLTLTKNVDFIIKGHDKEQLDVYGYKNQVDMTQLSIEARERINIIEPSVITPELDVFYPNPNNGIIYFKDYLDDVPYTMFNANGVLIDSGIIYNSRLEMPSNAKGIALLNINNRIYKVLTLN